MREQTNLLEETIEIMTKHGLTPSDVQWVGSRDGSIGSPWETFASLATDANYYAGHGGHEIVMDLVVVFGQGRWLERGEYDGAEWWEYKEMPMLQNPHKILEAVMPDTVNPRLVPMTWD